MALPAIRHDVTTGPLSAGHVFQMVREREVSSRAEIARATGLARSTVSQRVEALLALGLLVEDAEATSTGGRPPTRLRLNASGGVVLAADFGASHCRLAVTNLTGQVLAEEPSDTSIKDGPDVVLDWAAKRFAALLGWTGHSVDEIRGIGIGIPGPVEFSLGRAVSPPIMPGWDGVSIPDRLAPYFPGIPIVVDNDVNIMAMGEYWSQWRQQVQDLLFIKVATGIGAGLILGGRLHRGARGAAGDLGHVRASDTATRLCSCGNAGCVEAVASGAAVAADLRAKGHDVTGARDVVNLVREGNTDAARLVREAGRALGLVIAHAVNLLNPAVVVVGGDLAYAESQLFAGIREVVYHRSTVLSTSHLHIVRSKLEDRSGVTGAAVLALEQILSATAIDRALTEGAA